MIIDRDLIRSHGIDNHGGDRKEEVVTTPLSENKSSTKDVDELAEMPLMEKKSSTKDFDKGTD